MASETKAAAPNLQAHDEQSSTPPQAQQHPPPHGLNRDEHVEKIAHPVHSALPPLTAGRSSDAAFDDTQRKKLNAILTACQDQDVETLRALATSDAGLIDDHWRRAAWPLLLGSVTTGHGPTEPWQNLQRHRDEDQVSLDVNRSFVYYPKHESESRLAKRKEELSDTIVSVLRRHAYLCYFQGYHDIVQVFLLVLGAEAAFPAVERLSVLHIRDFMLPTMTGALAHLSLLPAILDAADHELYTHLSQTAPFYFALSATLTLYAHEIQEYGDIARLFDFLLANEAVMSIYFFTIIICSRKKQLLELEADEHDMLHSILSKLPSPLNLDDLIAKAAKLFHTHPPARLSGLAWYNISSNSVLKTTCSSARPMQQTLQDGERFFHQQAGEIERQDIRSRQLRGARRLALQYRRPAIYTAAAVTVAVLAVYGAKPSSSLRMVLEWGGRHVLHL
ncbi:hypothetical protein AMS68_005920 [Peltaster fructicola]|uniref:Rab-GAP TBC domain-containing protein n=1 Tax=Peltaster fructicola TaxID=286661 RepID=A0A6H0Y067_9PEZI|nr:hypothetical protein AMS68_005920 [Peltaster fructicola]